MSAGNGKPTDHFDAASAPTFLVMDTESVPDGRLIARVKYPGETLTPLEAVHKAQQEARNRSADGSDFLPVTFQYPVAVCLLRVGGDFRLQKIACLDAPEYRPSRIVDRFWRGIERYPQAKIVTFNGRGFDLPLLELAAFRYGCCCTQYMQRTRHRYNGHFDIMDWLSNYGACRLSGGLDLLSKILGKPGKMAVTGQQVFQMHQDGRLRDINDYCMFDTLDTYFVFLRTRVLTGDLSLQDEHALVQEGRRWLEGQVGELPALRQYLDSWGDWEPWP